MENNSSYKHEKINLIIIQKDNFSGIFPYSFLYGPVTILKNLFLFFLCQTICLNVCGFLIINWILKMKLPKK